MANLIDTIIKGTARVLGTVFAKKVQTDTLNAPTTSGGSTFGPGTNGQILKSNGTTMYWGDSSADSVPWTGVTGKPSTFTPTIGTTATTAAAGNHTHTTSLATSTGTSQLTLESGGKYVLTSGGTTYIFTMPTAPTTLPANGGNADTVDNKHAADFATSTQGTNADNHRAATNNPHSVTKAQVGLGNVTNDAQVKRSEMGVASGVATLDTNGKVPSSQLPSYVDDVLEYTSKTGFPTTGETGKIYVATDTNLTYRWGGSAYVEISASLALGETSSTAYRGDRGKIAYDHSQSDHAPSNAQANVIESVKVNGTALTVTSKAVNVTVPTKVSDLTNDLNFTSNTGTVTQVKIGDTAYNPSSGVISLPVYPTVSYPVTSVAGKTGAVTLARGDVGLGNVGNFKAVSTVASQELTDTEKSNARANIGAGTSNLTIGTTASTAAAGNHNHDSAYKKIQTAVSDPGANGTSLTFIATASQNTNGVISITKKTVSTMGGASSSANGTAGLVPAPSKGDEGKFLMGNGTWVTLVHATYDTSTTSTTDLNYVLS